MSLLEIKKLSYAYRKLKVLDEIYFEIFSGEIVGLLGVNGAGKSTLFKLISGLFFLQEGQIFFENKLAAKASKSIAASMRAKMGVVFQECSLDGKLPALLNLKLSAKLYGVYSRELDRKIADGLHLFNLSSFASNSVKTFSGGMKRRLELLRALLHKPQFLLMDEPSSGLDQEGFHHFWQMIYKNRDERSMTTLLATHKIEEAEKCDRLLILHNGRLIASKTPKELKNLVIGDRICLRFSNHATDMQKTKWVKVIQDQFLDLSVQQLAEEIVIIALDGHRLVPRLVEILPKSAIESVYVRGPTLADAFLHMTGTSL